LLLLIAAGGCAANPFSITVDALTVRMARRELATIKTTLLGNPVAKADPRFGPRNDTLDALDGGPDWVIYPDPKNPAGESFLVLELDPDGAVTGLSIWKRNRDGLPDVWKTKRLLKTCFTLTPAECEARASLGTPWRVFNSRATHCKAIFYNAGALIPGRGGRKAVILCFNEQDLCVEVRMAGIVAENTPQETTSPDTPNAPEN